jgi:MFS superfamily sulfate permease-like transporter
VVGELQGLVQGIIDGKVVTAAAALGIGSLAAILLLRRFARGLPSPLIAVAAAGVIVTLLDLTGTVPVVGQVPRGLPAIGVPAVSWSDLVDLFPTAVAVALISFADTSVISHSFAARSRERVDPDHELAALGVTQLSSALVGGFAASGSATRTPVAEQAGARTQVTGLVGALAILALLVLVPGLLGPVPTAALAAVVVSAAITLIDIEGLRHLWRVRRTELMPAAVAFLAVTCSAPCPASGAVALSLLIFVRNAWRPYDAVLGRVANYKGYHDIERHPEAKVVPGLILYRWDAPLFFANSELFREHVFDVVARAPTPPRWIAVASEPIVDVDTTAADMLDELIGELGARGVALHFAELKGGSAVTIFGIYDRLVSIRSIDDR